MRRPPVKIVCNFCLKELTKHHCHLRPQNFCDRECYRLSLIGRVQSCETRTKRSLSLSNDKAPTWKGGHSRQYKRGYKSEQFKHWRIAVFKRDAFTCQNCLVHGGYLTAHHIKSFAKFPDLRYEISNGTTLCEPCHSATDHYYKRLHPKVRKRG
jgi:5-methylcytosine-specific restriction endonuclease McrA